ncbi:MAG: hypothetical protein PUC00_02155 [Clostridiales bacterium]|nr:hypothetical protein [Clostridiales bacterium]
MRKLFALVLTLTTLFTMAYAETAFDPAQYTEEELREIDTLIHMHLTKTEEGTVLYDDNGIYIEYRGLYIDNYYDAVGVNLFIQNNFGRYLVFDKWNAAVNKATMRLGISAGTGLNDGQMHMTITEGNWHLKFEDLAVWEFTTIQSLDFTINVRDEEWTTYFSIPVSLTLDYPIVYPE